MIFNHLHFSSYGYGMRRNRPDFSELLYIMPRPTQVSSLILSHESMPLRERCQSRTKQNTQCKRLGFLCKSDVTSSAFVYLCNVHMSSNNLISSVNIPCDCDPDFITEERKRLQNIQKRDNTFSICPNCSLFGTNEWCQTLTCKNPSCGKKWCRFCYQIGNHNGRDCVWINPSTEDVKEKVQLTIKLIINLNKNPRCCKCNFPYKEEDVFCSKCSYPTFFGNNDNNILGLFMKLMKTNKHSFKVRKEIRKQAKNMELPLVYLIHYSHKLLYYLY
jgi:hypothetical protein